MHGAQLQRELPQRLDAAFFRPAAPGLQVGRELADELGYKGDKNDTAAMNTWLHKQVMKHMADNGGKVPANLMD